MAEMQALQEREERLQAVLALRAGLAAGRPARPAARVELWDGRLPGAAPAKAAAAPVVPRSETDWDAAAAAVPLRATELEEERARVLARVRQGELEASGPVSLAPALGASTSGGVGAALGGGDAPAPTAPGASPGGGFRYAGV